MKKPIAQKLLAALAGTLFALAAVAGANDEKS